MSRADGPVLALSGGVGGAKLALGLYRVLPSDTLTVAANTGDDFEHLGLSISPDIDTLLYTLSGQDNPELGWGRRGDGPAPSRFSRRALRPRIARRRDLPIEPVYQHRPDPRRPRHPHRAPRLPGAGRRCVADHRRPGGQGPDRQDDGGAGLAGR